MNVLVAAVGSRDCPAARALLTEGVPCEIAVCSADLDYGDALAAMWSRGEGFVVIEHDVVPWPGAMEAWASCEHPWCTYRYPFAPGKIRNALGCVRFSDELVRAHPDLPEQWQGAHWNEMDGRVYRAVKGVLGTREDPHLHEPPLAHVKAHAELAA